MVTHACPQADSQNPGSVEGNLAGAPMQQRPDPLTFLVSGRALV